MKEKTVKKHLKFDNVLKSRILELASLSYSTTDIAKLLDIHRMTLHRWIVKHKLKDLMNNAEEEVMRSTIKRGLVALSQGATSQETTKEFLSEDAMGQVVKTTERIKIDAPNHKAIQILSQKYDKAFQVNAVDHEPSSSLTLNVNMSGYTMRELQCVKSPLGSIVDAESQVVDDEDDVVDSDPPTKD